MRLFTFVAASAIASSPGSADEQFPTFDYEVICYASNIFAQQGNALLSDISSCKKDEEEARDLVKTVWPKLLPEGRSHCVEYARKYARGSYKRLEECVSIGLLLSFKEGLLVRAPTKPEPGK